MPYANKKDKAAAQARYRKAHPERIAKKRREYDEDLRTLGSELKEQGSLINNNRNTRQQPLKPFIGVDGEGGTRDGKHGYYLLRIGEELLYKNGRELTWYECIEFIYKTGKDSGGILVAFFFNYDVTMITRSLPIDKLKELYDRPGRTQIVDGKSEVRKVNLGEFLIDHIPGKFFIVSKFEENEKGERRMHSVEINDLSGFYQCSFVKALETWKVGDKETIDRIKKDKARRSEFTGSYSDEEIEYNRQEVRLLETLADRLRTACFDAGIRPSRWQGAGCLASSLFSAHGVSKKTAQALPARVLEAAQYAYFGGRFETSVVGDIRQPISEADISSAYPAAMVELSDFSPDAGEWSQDLAAVKRPESLLKGDHNFIALIHWKATRKSDLWGPFLWRSNKGRIFAPREGFGWQHGFEILEALKQGISIKVLECWRYVQLNPSRPYHWIHETFARRVSMGAQESGIVLKLGMNSLYGKTCQSIGSAPYANPIIAGQITSHTRSKLYSVFNFHQHRDVVMVATDAVYLREKPKFPTSEFKSLGAWDAHTFKNMFIVQPGLYYCGDEIKSNGKVKTRGLPQLLVKDRLADFKRLWRRDGFDAKLPIKIPNSFIGCREALHRNKPELAGQWISETRIISFHPVKRIEGPIIDGEGQTTMPPRAPEMSAIYKKAIGGAVLSARNDYQNETTAFPEHPDGSVYELDQNLESF